MFSIRLCGQTSAKMFPNNVNIDESSVMVKNTRYHCSYYPSEMEILMMPGFMFTVLDIKEPNPDEIGACTVIELQEVPYQEQLRYREVYYSQVVWADPNINPEGGDFKDQVVNIKKLTVSGEIENFHAVKNAESTVDKIHECVNCVLIMDWSIAEDLIPKLCMDFFDKPNEHTTNLSSIILTVPKGKTQEVLDKTYMFQKVRHVVEDVKQVSEHAAKLWQEAKSGGLN